MRHYALSDGRGPESDSGQGMPSQRWAKVLQSFGHMALWALGMPRVAKFSPGEIIPGQIIPWRHFPASFLYGHSCRLDDAHEYNTLAVVTVVRSGMQELVGVQYELSPNLAPEFFSAPPKITFSAPNGRLLEWSLLEMDQFKYGHKARQTP